MRQEDPCPGVDSSFHVLGYMSLLQQSLPHTVGNGREDVDSPAVPCRPAQSRREMQSSMARSECFTHINLPLESSSNGSCRQKAEAEHVQKRVSCAKHQRHGSQFDRSVKET